MPSIWPSDLPQKFLHEGYSEGPGDGRLRTSMDAGPRKTRRRFTAVVRPMAGRLLMTDEQLANFKLFISEIGGGSLPFNFPDPHGGDDLLVKFAEDMPSWVPDGPFWRVTMPLEVLP